MFPGPGFWSAGSTGDASPANLGLSNLHAWYDASDVSSLTVSAGSVDQWRDKSGNAFHLAGPTAGDRPIATAQNGKAAVSFSAAASQWLENAAAAVAFRNRQVYTVAVVWRAAPTSPPPTSTRWRVGNSAAGFPLLDGTHFYDNFYGGGENYVEFERNSPSGRNAVFHQTAEYDGATRVFVMRANAAQIAIRRGAVDATASSTSTLTGDMNIMTLGCRYKQNVREGFSNGVCCEVAVWLADHWASRAGIHAHLKAKWGAE